MGEAQGMQEALAGSERKVEMETEHAFFLKV